MSESDLGAAWSLPGVLGFFDQARATSGQVYASEWVFLSQLLRPGLSVLDIGCAQGGFASVLGEHLTDFHYTGIDVSEEMIARARTKHPGHEFHHVPEADFSVLGARHFDLVLVLGILHLHRRWRDTIAEAWRHTGTHLLLDLREHEGATIEDPARSHFRMDFGDSDERHSAVILPYVVVNSADALATVKQLTPGARRLSHYGYTHPVSPSASTPVRDVMANVWLIER